MTSRGMSVANAAGGESICCIDSQQRYVQHFATRSLVRLPLFRRSGAAVWCDARAHRRRHAALLRTLVVASSTTTAARVEQSRGYERASCAAERAVRGARGAVHRRRIDQRNRDVSFLLLCDFFASFNVLLSR